jgi:hypothetical protein
MLKIILLIFTVINLNLIYSQEENPSGSGTDNNTISKGYWILSDSKEAQINNDKLTNWVGTNSNLTAEFRWIDQYKIEHSINSQFNWERPQLQMIPGSESYVTAKYENIDYSTSSYISTGIEVKLENAAPWNSKSITDILRYGKNVKNPLSEVTKGKFKVPYFNGSDRHIQISVHCFVGKDNYVETYIYDWIDNP